MALETVRSNKMRSALTILGVVIGIAAVTTMVSIGQSAHLVKLGLNYRLGAASVSATPSPGVPLPRNTILTLWSGM